MAEKREQPKFTMTKKANVLRKVSKCMCTKSHWSTLAEHGWENIIWQESA